MKKNQNKFGGERLDLESNFSKNNVLEHLARYEFVYGKKESTVLDIGCGTGHGSAVLARKFKKVYGVDVSEEAIQIAKNQKHSKNINFLTGSGTSIPFADRSFDIVVAFEVFEHIKDWNVFLSELKRVTKKGGKIFISTPNKDIYSPGTKKPINPHHFFEMTIPQFKKALTKYFLIENFFGQRTPIYNDHPIWKLVDPLLFSLKNVIPYKWNNTVKLKIINWIKPELDLKDIVFHDETKWVKKSRQMLAVCKNK